MENTTEMPSAPPVTQVSPGQLGPQHSITPGQQFKAEPTPKVETKATVQIATQSTTEPQADSWNDDAYNKQLSKYKDPKELGKAKWLQDKEMTKILTEKKALEEKLKSLESGVTKSTQTEVSPKSTASTETQSSQQTTSDPAQAAAETASLSYKDINALLAREIMENGKVGEASINALKTLGFTESEARAEVRAKEIMVQERIKLAQSHVKTPLTELMKFSEQQGNFTDNELVQIQTAIQSDMFEVLGFVERRYKESQTKRIENGSPVPVGQTGPAGDTYSHPDEFYAEKTSPRYMRDPDYQREVEAKRARSDTSKWNEIMLYGGKASSRRAK